MLLATTVELFDGLVARGIPGPGPARRDRRHREVRRHPRAHRRTGRRGGTGRSGRRADRGPRRGAGGADRRAERGGRRAAGQHRHHRRPARDGLGRRRRRRAGRPIPDVLHLQRTTAFGHYDDGFVLALQRRTDHLGARGARGRQPSAGVANPRPAHRRRRRRPRASGRVHRQRPSRASCSPTARARSCTATASRSASRPWCSPPTTAPTSAAFDLHDAGVRINAIVDARADVPAAPARRRAPPAASRCGPDRWSAAPAATRASPHAIVSRPGRQPPRRRRGLRRAAGQRRLESGGAPVQPGPRQAALRRRPRRVRTRRASRRRSSVAGSANGVFDLPGCLRSGREAAAAALARARLHRRHRTHSPARPIRCSTPRRGRGAVAGARPGRARTASSSTSSATRRSPTWSARSGRACARWSTSSATPRSAPPTIRARPPASSPPASPPNCSAPRWRTWASPRSGRPTRRSRSPRSPAAAAAHMFDPERVTAVHDWHVARGAVFEDVGQWKRPRYYPLPRRGHGDRGAARMCRRPRRSRHPRRLHARQDRRAGPATPACSSTCSTRT